MASLPRVLPEYCVPPVALWWGASGHRIAYRVQVMAWAWKFQRPL